MWNMLTKGHASMFNDDPQRPFDISEKRLKFLHIHLHVHDKVPKIQIFKNSGSLIYHIKIRYFVQQELKGLKIFCISVHLYITCSFCFLFLQSYKWWVMPLFQFSEFKSKFVSKFLKVKPKARALIFDMLLCLLCLWSDLNLIIFS